MVQGGDAVARAMSQTAFLSRDEEVKQIRGEAVALVREVSGDSIYNDVNYVFPTFVADPSADRPGRRLLIAAIFAAAMSTISAELAALSTATRDRLLPALRARARRPSDAQLLRLSRLATGVLGGCSRRSWRSGPSELGSLIEVVNRFGSFFYGSILGVFLLAIGWQRANGTGAFVGVLVGHGDRRATWRRSPTIGVPLAQPDRRRRGVRRRHRRVGDGGRAR